MDEARSRGRMHRYVVNRQSANIFKGVFEVQKSAKNAENFAKIARFAHQGLTFTTFALTMTRPMYGFTAC
jgi:hypothetical protein